MKKLRKYIALILMTVMLFSAFSAYNAGAFDTNVTDALDGCAFLMQGVSKGYKGGSIEYLVATRPTATLIEKDGVICGPIRFIAEAVGGSIGVENEKVKVTYNEKILLFEEGSTAYTLNGEGGTLSTPIFTNGSYYAPLSEFAQALGVDYYEDRCGYIIIGGNAKNFDLSDVDDREILNKVVRKMVFENPTTEQVLNDLAATTPQKQHPRLLVTPERVLELKSLIKTDANAIKWYEKVKEEADSYLTAEKLEYGRTDGVRMLATARIAKMQISNLAFMYLLTDDTKYSDKAIEIALNICSFSDWNPYHFLDIGEMVTGAAICFDWCYNELEADEKTIIRNAIVNLALKEFKGDVSDNPSGERTWNWWSRESTGYPNNWVSVIYGGCVMGALAVADEDSEAGDLAAWVIANGMEKEKDLLAGFAPDGAWHEGPTYWKYAYEYFSFGFESLKTALGTDYGLGNAPGIKNGPYYIIGSTGPTGTFNISDADCAHLNCHELMWAAKYYNDPGLGKYRINYMQEQNLTPNYRDLIYYDPAFVANDVVTQTDGYFRNFEVSAARASYDPNDLYVAFHGGDASTAHSHLDYGEFIFDLFGKRWAMELGKDDATYVLGNYRFNFYRDRAEGHNTLVINPSIETEGNKDQNSDNPAPISRFESNEAGMISVADITTAYSDRKAKSVVRGIKVDKVARSVTVQDEIEMNEASELYWFMHTPGKLAVSENGRYATITYGDNKIQAQLTGDASLKFSVMQAVPLPTSPTEHNGMADDSSKTKLTIHAENITKTAFAVKFSPLCGNEKALESTEGITSISAWQLDDASDLPTLSSIAVNGKALDGFTPETTMYTAEYDEYSKEAENAISATGNGTITIVQPTESNACAKVTVTENGKSRVYFINMKHSFADIELSDFTEAKPRFKGVPSAFKNVTVFAADATYNAERVQNALDVNTTSFWEAPQFGTEITFDLGAKSKFNHIGLAFENGSATKSYFRILFSDDGADWTHFADLKSRGISSDVEVYDVGEQKARYIKLIAFGTESGAKFRLSEARFLMEDGLIIFNKSNK